MSSTLKSSIFRWYTGSVESGVGSSGALLTPVDLAEVEGSACLKYSSSVAARVAACFADFCHGLFFPFLVRQNHLIQVSVSPFLLALVIPRA